MATFFKYKYKNRFFFENLRISFISIAGNKVRAALTIAIIAVGIMSLVGIITATEALKGSIYESFSSMGAGSFKIKVDTWKSSEDAKKSRRNFQITYNQAERFKKAFSDDAKVSIGIVASGGAIAKYESLKTNPNVKVEGLDENSLFVRSMELEKGRSFTSTEAASASQLAIIGADIVSTLFPNVEPLGKYVSIGGKSFRVIGVLKKKGAAMGMSNDRNIYIPVTTAATVFSIPSLNFQVTVKPNDASLMEKVAGQAEGVFRVVRGLRPTDSNDFVVEQSDALAGQLISNINSVVLAAYLIGLITLAGASVGLMNIMLVAVSEKTKEIGTRMALGAKSGVIKQQFLMESIIISQIGGAIGIVIGVFMGYLVSIVMSATFVIPWMWIGLGVLLCLVVGIMAGYLPAVKASKLSPIEALRYE